MVNRHLKSSAFMLSLLICACRHSSQDSTFGLNDSLFLQPVTKPLQLSEKKPLTWETRSIAGVKPDIRSFDLNALATMPYDTGARFLPFKHDPVEAHFSFDSIPGRRFQFDPPSSVGLKIKPILLPPPIAVTFSIPPLRLDETHSFRDVDQTEAFFGKGVTCMFKDKAGMVWMSTSEELYRFDGVNLQLVVSKSILKAEITCISEDDKGRIWFFSSAGIGILEPAKGILSRSDQIANIPRWLTKLNKDQEGRFWITGSTTGGVYVIDPTTMTFKHVDKRSGLKGDVDYGLAEDQEGNLWVADAEGNKGLTVLNAKAGTVRYFERTYGKDTEALYNVTIDSMDQIWAFSGHQILYCINAKKGTVTTYDIFQYVKDNIAFSMMFDSRNRLWIGFRNGAAVVDFQAGKVKNLAERGRSNFPLFALRQDELDRIWEGAGNGSCIVGQLGELVFPGGRKPYSTLISSRGEFSASTLLEDAKGRIWMGTAGGGIHILDEKEGTIRDLNTENGLSDNTIELVSRKNDQIWINTAAGLDIVDLKQNILEKLGATQGITAGAIFGVIKDKAGNIAIAAYGKNGGVYFIDSLRRTVRFAGIAQGLTDSSAEDILQDDSGKFWVAYQKGGIDVLDPDLGTIQHLNSEPGLRDSSNKSMMKDSHGRIWIGTRQGSFIIDPLQNTLTRLSTREGLPDNAVSSQLEYRGKVVLRAGTQLVLVSPPELREGTSQTGQTGRASWKIEPTGNYEHKSAIFNNWNSDYITSDGKYLWGDVGITILNKIQPDTAYEATFVTGLSLSSTPQYFTSQVELSTTDTLWGVDTFYTKGQTPVLASFAVQNGFRWDSVSGPYNMPVGLRVPYDKSTLRFQFAQRNAGSVEIVWYRYFLSGIDKSWSKPTSNPFSDNYLNLPTGDYTFMVSSKSIDGHWLKPAQFHFTVVPPWWNSWWAWTLYLLLLACGIYTLVHQRSKRLLVENARLEDKIKRRTEDLQTSIEQLKAAQAQLVQAEKMASLGELTAGIAHEIQNPLNFVNNFAEVNTELATELKEELDKVNIPDANRAAIEELLLNLIENQRKINLHGKRADSIVKGMLQHSRASTGQKELTNINFLADEYLRLSYHGLRAKDKSFNAQLETHFDPNLPEIDVLSQDLGRVFLNLFTNAFYSVMQKKRLLDANFQPLVSVSTRKIGQEAEIRVKDNGMGIPQAVLDKIFNPFFTTKPTGEGTGLGLSLSYDIIMKAHNGTIKVNTAEGSYAEFVIRLPIG